jgi:hypothetical protein
MNRKPEGNFIWHLDVMVLMLCKSYLKNEHFVLVNQETGESILPGLLKNFKDFSTNREIDSFGQVY